ncbi:MAG TPA: S49 family peptidase, partial [Dehalococcoidia bacterium]|nr:S49 family peptidase [Dehalococcoidia bacterium]
VTKSGPFKDMGLIFREPTEEERRKEQELIDSFFQRFLELVAQARGLSQEKLREYATGEVFTAGRGRELGLLDELGDLDRAVDLAAEMANVPRRVSYVRLRRPLAERLFSPAMASLTETVEGLLASAVVYRRPS